MTSLIRDIALAIEGQTVTKVYWSPADERNGGQYTRNWLNIAFANGQTLVIVEIHERGQIAYRMLPEQEIDRSRPYYVCI